MQLSGQRKILVKLSSANNFSPLYRYKNLHEFMPEFLIDELYLNYPLLKDGKNRTASELDVKNPAVYCYWS